MFNSLTGEYVGHHRKIDWKAEAADRKAWYNGLPKAQRAVMEVFPRYTCAHTRMCDIGQFLRGQGVDPIPKADVQYEMAYELLDELVAWLKEHRYDMDEEKS